MDIAAIHVTRRRNLMRLISARFGGNQTAFATRIGRGPAQVSQWIKGRRNVSDETRDHIEASCDAPGWLDAPITPSAEHAESEFGPGAEDAGQPRTTQATPVVGTARLGEDGFFEELQHPVGHGDGWVEGHTADPNAYALRVKGDSMHPAIRHGWFVVVAPNSRCMPGEYVAIGLLDGRKMVKELVIERPDEIVIESVNGNHRQTITRSDIETMHAVAAVVSASQWRPSR